jgi:hypothetical protein
MSCLSYNRLFDHKPTKKQNKQTNKQTNKQNAVHAHPIFSPTTLSVPLPYSLILPVNKKAINNPISQTKSNQVKANETNKQTNKQTNMVAVAPAIFCPTMLPLKTSILSFQHTKSKAKQNETKQTKQTNMFVLYVWPQSLLLSPRVVSPPSNSSINALMPASSHRGGAARYIPTPPASAQSMHEPLSGIRPVTSAGVTTAKLVRAYVCRYDISVCCRARNALLHWLHAVITVPVVSACIHTCSRDPCLH